MGAAAALAVTTSICVEKLVMAAVSHTRRIARHADAQVVGFTEIDRNGRSPVARCRSRQRRRLRVAASAGLLIVSLVAAAFRVEGAAGIGAARLRAHALAAVRVRAIQRILGRRPGAHRRRWQR